jgi:hypothetical protein
LSRIEVRLPEDVVDRAAEARVELHPTRKLGLIPAAEGKRALVLVDRRLPGHRVGAAEEVGAAALQREADSVDRIGAHQVGDLDREAQRVAAVMQLLTESGGKERRHQRVAHDPVLRAVRAGESPDTDLGDRARLASDHPHLHPSSDGKRSAAEDAATHHG